MRIDAYISPTGGTTHNVTPYLAEDNALVLTKERERERFEWVVDDMHVVLSNIDGYVRALIDGMSASDKWRFAVHRDGARVWQGIIETSTVEFRHNEDWVEFDVMPVNSYFWKTLETTRARPLRGLPKTINYPLSTLFERQLMSAPGPFADLAWVKDVQLGNFAARQIKFDSLTKFGGRMVDLDPRMTWKELLLEMLKYYNAQLWVDSEGTLRMARRSDYVNETATDLTGLVMEDYEPLERAVRDEVLDYIETNVILSVDAPLLSTVNYAYVPYITPRAGTGVNPGDYYYKILYYDSGRRERLLSPSLKVTVQHIDYSRPPWNLDAYTDFADVWVTMPKCAYADIAYMSLWRESWPMFPDDPPCPYKNVTEIITNESVTFHDNTPTGYLRTLGTFLPSVAELGGVSAWIGYNQTTGWTQAIPDLGNNQPFGRSYDIRPMVRFTEPLVQTQFGSTGGEKVLEYSPVDVLAFFNNEMTLGTMKEFYWDLFHVRRSLSVKVRGTDYELGDKVRAPKDERLARHGDMLVMKAEISYMTDTTILELMPL